jgi:hypothetical protein
MRHLGTLLAALVIAPTAWILMALGQDGTAGALAGTGDGGMRTGDFVRPLLFLAAAGLLLGVVATLRFSPLGAVVTGAVYASSYALLLIAPEGQLATMGHQISLAGQRADLSTPIRTGTALLVGGTMLVAGASVGRWRRWPRPDTVVAAPPPAPDFQLPPPPARPVEEEAHWVASLRSGAPY